MCLQAKARLRPPGGPAPAVPGPAPPMKDPPYTGERSAGGGVHVDVDAAPSWPAAALLLALPGGAAPAGLLAALPG